MNKKINIEKFMPIIIFLIGALVIFARNLNETEIAGDKIWLFHMTEKIAMGELPYKEINMIVTPLFYYIGALFFKIFGTSMVVFNLYGGIIGGAFFASAYMLAKEISDNKPFIAIMLFELAMIFSNVAIPCYNTMMFVFMILIILFEIRRTKHEEKKNKYNIIIGILLALTFFTKQTIGGICVIITAIWLLMEYICFEKKNIFKELLQRAAGFLIIFIPYIIYLIATNSLYDFIDIAFLSMLDFASKNASGSFFNLNVLISVIVIIAAIFAGKDKSIKDKTLTILGLYAIASVLSCIPLVNAYHLLISTFIPIFMLYKLAVILNDNKPSFAWTLIFLAHFVIIYLSQCVTLSEAVENGEVSNMYIALYGMTAIISYAIIILMIIANKKKASCIMLTLWGVISSSLGIFFWQDNINKNKIDMTGLEIYANSGIDKELLEKVKTVNNFIKQKENEGYNVYILSTDASIYMAPIYKNNNKLDLILQGNLGYKGEERLVKEIEKIENPLFLKNDELIFQESEIVNAFIKESYKEIGEYEGYKLYTK